MTPPTWFPARHVWQLLRAVRRAARQATGSGWPAGPERFEALLDTVARRGERWVSDELPVVKVLASGAARATWRAVGEPPLSPPAWRWLVARDLVATAGRTTVRARLGWAEEGATTSAVRWRVTADGRPRTYVVDLARSRWRRARAVGAMEFEAVDGAGAASCGSLALVGDLAQLERHDARWPLARRYVRGTGIECGALQNPLRVRRGTRVLYVDRLGPAEARRHYPELATHRLTRPHVIGDVHRLPIADGGVDFYIGNHLLEHAEDAIAGLAEMLRVVRPGGVVYVSVPDAGNPLDRGRGPTPLSHHVADHDPGLDRSTATRAHYAEYVASAHRTLAAPERTALVERYLAQRYSIHFHVFDDETFGSLLRHVCDRVGGAIVELARNPGREFDEHVAVLRRR